MSRKAKSKLDMIVELTEDPTVTSASVQNLGLPEDPILESVFPPPPVIIPTLPESFRSLVEDTVVIQSDDTRDVIEMLGNLLGVFDYKTNMASFWFLDTIALRVIELDKKLNEFNLSLFISWIAGEIKLIQEKQYTREQFFEEMGNLFLYTSDGLLLGKEIQHWEQLEYFMVPDIPDEKRTSTISTPSVNGDRRSSSVNLQEPNPTAKPRDSKESKIAKEVRVLINQTQNDTGVLVETTDPSKGSAGTEASNAQEVLDIIIDVTYDIFANAFHYAIVRAAFVEPIELQVYKLPYTLRIPRGVKLADRVEQQQQPPHEEKKGKGGKEKPPKDTVSSKKKGGAKKSGSDLTPWIDKTPPPPPSLADEEMLRQRYQYIQPLKNSVEATETLKAYDELV